MRGKGKWKKSKWKEELLNLQTYYKDTIASKKGKKKVNCNLKKVRTLRKIKWPSDKHSTVCTLLTRFLGDKHDYTLPLVLEMLFY